MEIEAEEAARRRSRRFAGLDVVGRRLGIELVDAGLGWCRLALRVDGSMLNPMGTCHGGVLFTLADAAFGYASNNGEDGPPVVALNAQIAYLAPVVADDRLVAEAREIARTGRTGLYDVTVTKAGGELVASFRGVPYRLRR